MTEKPLGSDSPMHERLAGKSMDELMHQDEYTPEELAVLLDVPVTLIEHDAFAGKLKSVIIEHRVICIQRSDALAWMNSRN